MASETIVPPITRTTRRLSRVEKLGNSQDVSLRAEILSFLTELSAHQNCGFTRMHTIHKFQALLFPGADAWLKEENPSFRSVLALGLLSIAVLSVQTFLIPNVWFRMALFYVVACPLAVITIKIRWSELVHPEWKDLASGPVAAAILYGLGWAGFSVLGLLLPELQQQTKDIYAWKDQVGTMFALLLLVFIIIPGEEILWRGAITVPLAAAYGPITGSVMGGVVFAIGHIATGSLLVVMAALAMGTFWGLMTLRFRSLVPAYLCHLLWDLVVLFVAPY